MKYGVIGERLVHSFSPRIHNALGNAEYQKLEVPRDKLSELISGRDFLGLNVTIPYKKDVIPFCDELSEVACEIGSVNTLYFDDGKLVGDNTDAYGMERMLARAGISLFGKKVLILGSGGTSLTAQYGAKKLGARETVVISRRGEVTYDMLHLHYDADVIINTTPVGMYPENGKSAVDISAFSHLSGVCDVVYNPIRTKLVLDAEERGIPVTGGLPMLVYQAVRAHELFFGERVDDGAAENIISRLLCDVSNVIFVGMPGCGKTTTGIMLSRLLGRQFYDLDHEIEKRHGVSPAELITTRGEQSFRDIEQEVTAEICRLSGCVISAGGGTVIREANCRAMKQNGIIVYLTRPLCELGRADRPLSKDDDALARLLSERGPVYEALADHTVPASDDTDAVSRKVAGLIFDDFRKEQV